MSATPSRQIRNNIALQRYELDVDGGIAFARYRLEPGVVIITHVETPLALRGQGIGSQVVEGSLHLIRTEKLKVRAGCSFARSYLAEHPEFADIIA